MSKVKTCEKCGAPIVEKLKNAYPAVVYFSSESDRDKFEEMVKASMTDPEEINYGGDD